MKKLKQQKDREATREVKYHKLLGRQAYCFFRNNSNYIAAEWQPGNSLDQFSRDELIKIPFENKLRCIISGFQDLETLHAHHRIHNDIKPGNFVLDLNNSAMHLIDFGGAHKQGTFRLSTYTPRYEDPYSSDNFSKDLYGMGFVIMSLFPEIYTVNFFKDKPYIMVKNNPSQGLYRALIDLVNTMMHTDLSKRCHARDALTYCEEILRHLGQLDKSILENIANATIHRTAMTVEDSLRGMTHA